MSQANLVSTNIRITPEQREFIRGSEYSLSKFVRFKIKEVMKLSEGQDLRLPPSDELQRSSNIG